MLLNDYETEEFAIDAVIATIDCFMVGKKWEYIGSPVTTGLRYISWYKEIGAQIEADAEAFRIGHKQHVISPNVQCALEFALNREMTNPNVFVPASLSLPVGFSHPAYMKICKHLIAKHCNRVTFIDGWTYSHGCLQEYLTAVKHSIKIYDQNNAQIYRADAIVKLNEAIDQCQSVRLPIESLINIRDELLDYV